MNYEVFKLADSDKVGSTWPKLERHLKERIQELREQNDSMNLDALGTAAVRGRIAELQLLLQAAEEDPPPIDLG